MEEIRASKKKKEKQRLITRSEVGVNVKQSTPL